MSDIHAPVNDILNLLTTYLISKNDLKLSDSCTLKVVVLGVSHLADIRKRKRRFGTVTSRAKKKLEQLDTMYKRTRNSNYFVIPEGYPDDQRKFKECSSISFLDI